METTTPKKHMKSCIKLLFTTCFVLILGGALGLQTCAANEVITSLSGTTFTGMTNSTFGYEFTVGSQAISVNSLGFYDPSPTNGLNYTHEVGLWDYSGNLLASVIVDSSTATLSASGFWYELIPIPGSVILSANTNYVLGAKYTFNVIGYDLGDIFATITSSPEVTYGTARNNYSMTFAFPDNVVGGYLDAGYFGPNMDYTVVPEPTTCAMLGLGLLAVVWSRRNRR
jgi:hypothetical protein